MLSNAAVFGADNFERTDNVCIKSFVKTTKMKFLKLAKLNSLDKHCCTLDDPSHGIMLMLT